MFACTVDENLKNELNKNSKNYWDVYIQEISELLGVRGKVLSLKDLEQPETLKEITTLVIGRQTGTRLTAQAKNNLEEWVGTGGFLLGFGLKGMDKVFGIRSVSEFRQTPDDYAIAGYFDLRPHTITHEIHPFLFIEQKLLILSDIEIVDINGGTELARLYEINGQETTHPAIVWNAFGRGFTGYFAFDVCKTVWLLHQGKPTSHLPENRFHPRPPDMMVIGENSTKIPYADEICFILQNMIAQASQPFIYQLPPQNEKMADALLYWGGDEYTGPVELSLKSSDWMREQGLPYHINIQENHPITPDEFRHITADNGHEISLFYHTLESNGFKMTEAMYLKQSEDFEKKVGYRPGATVNSVTRWNHWAGAAKWMLKAGGKADNSFGSGKFQLEHPMANGPVFGFAFGTPFPFYFYDDFKGENQKIEFMEQPIVCYEIGHRGSLLDHETDVSREVHFPLEMAIKYHMTLNMFYHPAYIARYPLCRKAILEILKYISDGGANVVHMGNDALAEWWEKRSQSTVENTRTENDTLVFDCDCRYKGGLVVKFLLLRSFLEAAIDGRWPVPYEIRKEFAGNWLFILVPEGKHQLRIKWA
jgi:hypothetical protein